MKKLHGKISNGKIKEFNHEIIKNLKNEVLLKEKPKPTTFEKAAKWLSEKIPLD